MNTIRPYRAVAVALGLFVFVGQSATAQDADNGALIYDRWCAECHGVEGRGDGPAADHMLPRPRDFVQARYQIRTTANGELPTDADILQVLELGMPGTAMPAWPNLSDSERGDVIAFLKTFSRFFDGTDPQLPEVVSDPGGGAEAIESGRTTFETLECWKCHGESGRGSGQSTPTLEDWREFPIRAADLTEPWMFNGGGSADEIYLRMMTGLDGTPMPAYSDAVDSDIVSPEELWNVAHYVASLAPTQAPRTADFVSASRVEGELPATPGDDVWASADAFYVPLVGQVIRPPRNFAPTVDGVWVRAVHDGNSVALHLSWGDPSNSPDSTWTEWQTKVVAAMTADGATLSPTEPMTDGIAVQFPVNIPDGAERPYFLMGEANDPVTLWTWDSRSGVAEATGRGLGRIDRLAGSDLGAEAQWNEGHWELVLTRSIESSAEGTIDLVEGVVIPTAILAWDGSSAESPDRGSVSSWIYLYLEEPSSSNVIIAPIVAILLSGGLLLLLVRGAQARAVAVEV